MTSRDSILKRIQSAKPPAAPLPSLPAFDNSRLNTDAFIRVVENIGGSVITVTNLREVQEVVKAQFPRAEKIASGIIPSTVKIDEQSTPDVLEAVDVAILQGEVGVAENGAIWVPEQNMLNRSLPFIAQHLVLVLQKASIVPDMHQAYSIIRPEKYGVFIAGPSKTADIEQALVIGAHGARSLTVFLINA